METSNKNGQILGALLLGAAIGGALGILFAPDKGSETRKKLSAKGDDLSDALKNKLDEFQDQILTEIDKVKAKANEFIENGAAKAENFKINAN